MGSLFLSLSEYKGESLMLDLRSTRSFFLNEEEEMPSCLSFVSDSLFPL